VIHRLPIRVYYEDTDAGGVVYHARYLAWAERARTEVLRHLGLTHTALVAEFGLLFVVRSANMDYLRPARLDDIVDVVTGPWAARGAAVSVRQGFWVGAHEIGRLQIGLAAIRAADGRPARIPARWVAKFGEEDRASEPSS